MIKDFLWFALKENVLVNVFYRYLAPRVFKVSGNNLSSDKPIINKDVVLSNGPVKQPLLSIKGYTSGTTNKPLTVYRSLKSILLEEYIVKSYLSRNGVSICPKVAVLRGDCLFDAKHKGPKFWQLKPFTKRLFLSSYHISERNAPLYLKQLEHYKPEVIMAYPSSIILLAKFACQLNWKPNWPLKCVLTSSEYFPPENQALIREVFGTLLDHYGQAERVAALQLCRQGHYHIRQDYSHVEILRNAHGEHIVGTNIHNAAMPLQRYDTNDYVEGFNAHSKCSCGDSSPYVEKIIGRDDDYLVLPNGTILGRIDSAFKGLSGIVEGQIEQVALDHIVVRYVAQENYDQQVLKKNLNERLRHRIGDDLLIDFVEVSQVPRTKAGKFRSVIRDKSVTVPSD